MGHLSRRKIKIEQSTLFSTSDPALKNALLRCLAGLWDAEYGKLEVKETYDSSPKGCFYDIMGPAVVEWENPEEINSGLYWLDLKQMRIRVEGMAIAINTLILFTR